MDPRAYRIAQEFVRAHVRRARYAPEFLRVVDPQKFRNPETGNEVRFVSLPDEEQQRLYAQWRTKNIEESPRQETPKTPEEITARNIDIVKNGQEVVRQVLSGGGRGDAVGVNASFIVRLAKDGQSQNFIYKPASGEEPHLRIGIPAGQYHAREQAAYSIDAMMGGQGVVPVTHTRGKEDGSYQLWAQNARAMHGKGLNELVDKVSVDDLSSSPDFERVNVMDLLLGHEDRHRGNLLYHFDGDETPENLRFVAIDNGLSLAAPSDDKNHRVYAHPFRDMYADAGAGEDATDPFAATPSNKEEAAAAQAAKKGDAVVAKTLSNISPEMHKRIKKLDLRDVAKSMSSAGVEDEGAVRAALVRIAAVQEDPKVFQGVLDRNGGDLENAWRDFQHLSGTGDLRTGAREDDINTAVAQAKPQGGWVKGPSAEDAIKAMAELAQWGQSGPNNEEDFSMLANVRDRWLKGFLKQGRGRTLTVSEVDPRTQKKRVVGVFKLERDDNVKESYKDHRFRRDIQRGIRLMGKRFVPKDGPKFMGALEKTYGARSLFDVKRT